MKLGFSSLKTFFVLVLFSFFYWKTPAFAESLMKGESLILTRPIILKYQMGDFIGLFFKFGQPRDLNPELEAEGFCYFNFLPESNSTSEGQTKTLSAGTPLKIFFVDDKIATLVSDEPGILTLVCNKNPMQTDFSKENIRRHLGGYLQEIRN